MFGTPSNEDLAEISRQLEQQLDEPLYNIPGTNVNFTKAESLEGTIITGSTGSGKSSGPAKHIALSMLRAGYGFFVLCAKPSERETWQEYARLTGRTNDLVIFNKNSDYKFNFLEYEMTRGGQGAGEPLNIVNTLMGLNEQAKIYQAGGDGKDSEKFWDQSLRRLISRCVKLLSLADQDISILNMRKIVSSCFDKAEVQYYNNLLSDVGNVNLDDEHRQQALLRLDELRGKNYFLRVYETISNPENPTSDNHEEIIWISEYWMREFANLSDRTKSVIVESYMGLIEPLTSGVLHEKFSEGLSPELLPEMIYQQRKIVIVDFSLKEFGIAAIYAATIMKTTFQAAMERRNVKLEASPIQVALWIDEYQSYVSPLTDSMFQTTARSSWVATIYITQNMDNLLFTMGSNAPEARVMSLLGNMNCKFLCSNDNFRTNEWASKMIGQEFIYPKGYSIARGEVSSQTVSPTLHPKMPPEEFTTLKTGRAINDFKVEAIVFKAGKIWDRDGSNYAKVEFDQRQA